MGRGEEANNCRQLSFLSGLNSTRDLNERDDGGAKNCLRRIY